MQYRYSMIALRKLNCAQFGFEQICGMYMYMQRSPVEIRTPAGWNVIGHSITRPAACVIAQQYSSGTFIPARKNSARVRKR